MDIISFWEGGLNPPDPPVLNILATSTTLHFVSQAFVHVSTAFTHCPRHNIDECFYDTGIHYEDLISKVAKESDEALEAQRSK